MTYIHFWQKVLDTSLAKSFGVWSLYSIFKIIMFGLGYIGNQQYFVRWSGEMEGKNKTFICWLLVTSKKHQLSIIVWVNFFFLQKVHKCFPFRLLRIVCFRKRPSLPEVLCCSTSSPASCSDLWWLPSNSDAATTYRQLPWYHDRLHERYHEVCNAF